MTVDLIEIVERICKPPLFVPNVSNHSSPQEFKHATFQTHACLSCNSRQFPEGGSVIKLKQSALQRALMTARPPGAFANLLRKLVAKLKRQTKIYKTRGRKCTLGC